MNIGFVSVWAERGAGYVTKAYANLLKDQHKIFIYARAGEHLGPTPMWNQEYVTWGEDLPDTRISWRKFKRWVRDNRIDIIFFNEQRDFRVIYKCKLEFPNVKVGTYIDYYRQDMISKFSVFDFLICNTKRHFKTFSWHPQAFFVPWGTDINLFKPGIQMKSGTESEDDTVVFFHSAGMAVRKGTALLIKVFTETDLWKRSRLILHTQRSLSDFTALSEKELQSKNIQVVQGTISAPGLYSEADVYVYPTTLDGLGLTIYEALSSGLPVITSDNAPMNEVITNENGRLVKIEKYTSREDGYYWPLCHVDPKDLYLAMDEYIGDKDNIINRKKLARNYALKHLNLADRSEKINNIFSRTRVLPVKKEDIRKKLANEKVEAVKKARNSSEFVLPTPTVVFERKLIGLVKEISKILKRRE